MPIKIPDGLPAGDLLAQENIFVMPQERAAKQDIRPLRIAIYTPQVQSKRHGGTEFTLNMMSMLAGSDAAMRVEEAGDLNALTAALEADRDFDLVLLDLNMPGAHGISGLLLLRAQYPEVPVMIISGLNMPPGLAITTRTPAVRVLASSKGSMKLTVPVKVLPGMASEVKCTVAPVRTKGRSPS